MSSRLLLFVLLMLPATGSLAAGTLTPQGAPDRHIEIRDHDVQIVINNGFAQTVVTQTFFNPNGQDLEGIYAFPVPREASLSEMSITIDEQVIEGEVLAREDAERIYEEEKDAGNDAGLATRESYQRFEFRVSPIRAQAETRVRFVYYQPLEIDTGIGRYLYPLEEGGTDELAKSFWTSNEKVERSFTIDAHLRSAYPISDVRAPGYEAAAKIETIGQGEYRVRVESQGGALNRDFVLYYKLADDLPGRVDLLPYKPDPNQPGHFMLVVTPGLDLQPLEDGADYVFVLDTSGSMKSKLGTLAAGVRRAIGELSPEDRFRVVAFSDRAYEVVGDWTPASPSNVQRTLEAIENLSSSGGTNVYEGLELGLDDVDADRVTSLILVTDGVTNTGVVDPAAFHKLMKAADVRVFGFLMGNSANWPLMRTVCEASGGFYANVSNADDVLGQVLLAKSKIVHEALTDVELEFAGVRVFDTTGRSFRKVYRGQQLVLFGRYEDGGAADLAMNMRMSGDDRELRTRILLPEQSDAYPEIERLYGMAAISELEVLAASGMMPPEESETAIRDLGVAYQLVNDETAMLVLSDTLFERHGIERKNRKRVADERQAQTRRRSAPVAPTRIDRDQPMFKGPSPRLGSGAFGFPHLVGVLGLAWAATRRGRGANPS